MRLALLLMKIKAKTQGLTMLLPPGYLGAFLKRTSTGEYLNQSIRPPQNSLRLAPRECDRLRPDRI